MSEELYCLKCKSKRPAKDLTNITLKNGRPALQGNCTHCNTKVFRITKKSA